MQKEIYNINPSWFCSGVCLCQIVRFQHGGTDLTPLIATSKTDAQPMSKHNTWKNHNMYVYMHIIIIIIIFVALQWTTIYAHILTSS